MTEITVRGAKVIVRSNDGSKERALTPEDAEDLARSLEWAAEQAKRQDGRTSAIRSIDLDKIQ